MVSVAFNIIFLIACDSLPSYIHKHNTESVWIKKEKTPKHTIDSFGKLEETQGFYKVEKIRIKQITMLNSKVLD